MFKGNSATVFDKMDVGVYENFNNALESTLKTVTSPCPVQKR
jgi:hypothetical protein